MSFGINYPKHFCRTQPNFLWGGGGGGTQTLKGETNKKIVIGTTPFPLEVSIPLFFFLGSFSSFYLSFIFLIASKLYTNDFSQSFVIYQ